MHAVFLHHLSAVAFVNDGPIPTGYEVIEDVRFDDRSDNPDWHIGAAAPRTCLGRDPDDPRRFAVFASPLECRREGFEAMPPNWASYPDWADCAAKLRLDDAGLRGG